MEIRHSVYKWVYYLLWTLFWLAVQLTILPLLPVDGWLPFLPPILLACVLTFEKSPAVIIYAAVLGTWCDTFFGGVLLFSLLLPLAAFFIVWLSKNIIPRTLFVAGLWGLGLCLTGRLLYCLVFGIEPGWGILFETVYSLLYLPILYVTLRKG